MLRLQACFISSHRGQKPQGQEVVSSHRCEKKRKHTGWSHHSSPGLGDILPFLVSMASEVTIVPDSAMDEPEAKGSREQA